LSQVTKEAGDSKPSSEDKTKSDSSQAVESDASRKTSAENTDTKNQSSSSTSGTESGDKEIASTNAAEAIPSTGPAESLSAVVGTSMVTIAVLAYAKSRRNLAHANL
jgi:hypothetical protein